MKKHFYVCSLSSVGTGGDARLGGALADSKISHILKQPEIAFLWII